MTAYRSSPANEVTAVAEFARLFADPLYRGVDAPRGDGRPALVLPGLFGNDWYLWPLRAWLNRIGFRPVRSTLAFNAGCPERLRRLVERELRRRRENAPGPVILIGHSGGGILARAIAARLQANASHLILLGSPVGLLSRAGHWSRDTVALEPTGNMVVEAGFRIQKLLDPHCNVPNCGCAFPADFRRVLSPATRVVSIYSRDDALVPVQAAIIPGAENVEISGAHAGLVYNRVTYETLARVLR
jgi:pimeloyl-ACP methyl ester carboxylesterase